MTNDRRFDDYDKDEDLSRVEEDEEEEGDHDSRKSDGGMKMVSGLLNKSVGTAEESSDDNEDEDDAEVGKSRVGVTRVPGPPIDKKGVGAGGGRGKGGPGASAKKGPPKGKKKKEMNPRFKDLQETGQWGSVSRTETIAVGILVLLVIVGGGLGLWFGFLKGKNEVKIVSNRPAPTPAPTMIGPQGRLILALEAINSSPLTSMYGDTLSQELDDYKGMMEDPNATPQQRAMSWLVEKDDHDIPEEVSQRWALASLYYGLGGEKWTSAQNWLSSDSFCEWEHIRCNLQTNTIQEIGLQKNNLLGTIPPELTLLTTTQALWFRENQLVGTLPNEIFGSMPQLSILYLDDNQLSGTISTTIRDNQILSTLIFSTCSLTRLIRHSLKKRLFDCFFFFLPPSSRFTLYPIE